MLITIRTKEGEKKLNLGRSASIREHCKGCFGWEYEDSMSKTIRDCTGNNLNGLCHIHKFRFTNIKGEQGEIRESIWNYCIWCMGGQKKEVKGCVDSLCSLFVWRCKGVKK